MWGSCIDSSILIHMSRQLNLPESGAGASTRQTGMSPGFRSISALNCSYNFSCSLLISVVLPTLVGPYNMHTEKPDDFLIELWTKESARIRVGWLITFLSNKANLSSLFMTLNSLISASPIG